MKYTMIILLLLPALLCAQEFQFRQEFDTIPVEINGWQTFAPWGGGERESYPEFCDLDGDGDLDLFIGNYNGFITHYKNEGTNQVPDFQLITRAFVGINLALPPFGAHVAPRFCDMDGDGDKDLFVGDGEGYIHFWENVGTPLEPQFQLITDSLANINANGFARFDLIDIDSDGDFDLFLGNYYGNTIFYRNVGNATNWNFLLITEWFSGIDVGYFASPKFTDIDADGDFDLFIGNEAGHIWYYRNDGDSVNYNFTYITNNYNGIWVDCYAAPEFADIDGDGDYDLFVGRDNETNPNNPGDLFYYENTGSPTVPQWRLITQNYLSLDQGNKSQNHHADIDADGDMDLFSANFNNRISFYQNIGNPDSAEFQWITDAYQDIAVNGDYIFFNDIDADQDSDLFVGEVQIPNPPYPGLHLFQNRGTPQSAQFSLYSSNLVPGNIPVGIIPALADIDGDGDDDLFITNNGDIRYDYENIGTPTTPIFANPTQGWFGTFPPYQYFGVLSFCFYDIDNDGDLDLFGVPHGENGGKWVWFYRNVGNSQNPLFDLETEYLLPLERDDTFIGIDIVDIDDDGDGDIFLSLTYDGGMYFFRNITGEASAPPPVQRHPRAGLQISLGPNPANPITVVSCQFLVPSNISLQVFDISGRMVVELASGFHLPGEYRYVWDASGKSAGMYFIRLRAGEYAGIQKIVLLK